MDDPVPIDPAILQQAVNQSLSGTAAQEASRAYAQAARNANRYECEMCRRNDAQIRHAFKNNIGMMAELSEIPVGGITPQFLASHGFAESARIGMTTAENDRLNHLRSQASAAGTRLNTAMSSALENHPLSLDPANALPIMGAVLQRVTIIAQEAIAPVPMTDALRGHTARAVAAAMQHAPALHAAQQRLEQGRVNVAAAHHHQMVDRLHAEKLMNPTMPEAVANHISCVSAPPGTYNTSHVIELFATPQENMQLDNLTTALNFARQPVSGTIATSLRQSGVAEELIDRLTSDLTHTLETTSPATGQANTIQPPAMNRPGRNQGLQPLGPN